MGCRGPWPDHRQGGAIMTDALSAREKTVLRKLRNLESLISDAQNCSIVLEDYVDNNLKQTELPVRMPAPWQTFVLSEDQVNGLHFLIHDIGDRVRTIYTEYFAALEHKLADAPNVADADLSATIPAMPNREGKAAAHEQATQGDGVR